MRSLARRDSNNAQYRATLDRRKRTLPNVKGKAARQAPSAGHPKQARAAEPENKKLGPPKPASRVGEERVFYAAFLGIGSRRTTSQSPIGHALNLS